MGTHIAGSANRTKRRGSVIAIPNGDPTDLVTVRSAAIETFHRRQSHQWPPVPTSSDSWARDYAGLITEHPDAPPTIDAAVDYLAGLIQRIDNT